MNWFKGEVAEAIQKALKENKIFIVYIEGDNEDSKKMGEIWNSELVANCCRNECCVAIRIKAGSLQGDQFAKCYPVLVVPSTYLINQSGVPTDIIPGFMEEEQFVKCIEKTLKINSMAATTTTKTVEEKTDSAKSSSSLAKENEIADEGVVNTPQESSQATGSLAESLRRAHDLAEKLRLEKEKKENEEEKEREKRRRNEGQQIAMAKRNRDDLKSKQWIEEQAKAKAEAKAAREAVRKKLEQDKMEKKMKFETEKENEKIKREARKRALEETKIAQRESTLERKTTRIQFRLPDGSAVTREFASEAQLDDVIQSITQDVIARFGNISLATVYPRRQFKDNEFNCTLRELNLVPSAALMVIPQQSSRQVTTGNSGLWDFIKFVLAPIIAILVYVKALLFGQTTDSNAPTNSSNVPPSSSTNSKRNENRQSRDDSTYKREGNVYKFKQDDDDDDDEDKTWNGNSTQQM